LRIAAGLLIVISCACLLSGDGGSLVARKQTGPFVISVFAADAPVRAGKADLSVMVQQVSDESPVMDATVMLRLTKATGSAVTEVAAPATHAKATNKTLYAAQLTIPSEGAWRLSADVAANGTNAEATADLNVMPPAPPAERYWPYIALIPFAVFLFAFNRWLRRRRQFLTPRARP